MPDGPISQERIFFKSFISDLWAEEISLRRQKEILRIYVYIYAYSSLNIYVFIQCTKPTSTVNYGYVIDNYNYILGSLH